MPQPGPSGVKRKRSPINTEQPSTSRNNPNYLLNRYDSDSDSFSMPSPIHQINLDDEPTLNRLNGSHNVLTAPDLQLDWATDSSTDDTDDEVIYIPPPDEEVHINLYPYMLY